MYLLFCSTHGKLMEGIIFICFLHFSISSVLENHLTQNNIMIFIPMTNSGGKSLFMKFLFQYCLMKSLIFTLKILQYSFNVPFTTLSNTHLLRFIELKILIKWIWSMPLLLDVFLFSRRNLVKDFTLLYSTF